MLMAVNMHHHSLVKRVHWLKVEDLLTQNPKLVSLKGLFISRVMKQKIKQIAIERSIYIQSKASWTVVIGRSVFLCEQVHMN